jgi:hypothetical protein
MRQSAKGVDTIGILARPENFASEGNKVVWLEFKDIYEVYHLDAIPILLSLMSVSGIIFMFIDKFITYVDLLINFVFHFW